MPCGCPAPTLLVVDDVGLGKTIETGLVIQELFLRHRARTALVVCPAGKDDAAQPASHVRVAAVRGGGDPAVRDGSDGPHDRALTLSIYAREMDRRDGEPERLRALVNGEEWAPAGTKASEAVIEAESA